MIKRSKTVSRQNSPKKSRALRQSDAPSRSRTSAQTLVPIDSDRKPHAIRQAPLAGGDLYRGLLETSSSVIIGLTPKHRIFEWNRAAERIYGWTREEVMGKNYLTTFVPKDIHEAVSADIRKVLKGIPIPAYENEVIGRSGIRHTLLWSVTRIVIGKGKVRGILAIGQDITERKQVEEERRKQEVLITLMLNTGPACIKRVAANGSLLHMNPTGLKLVEVCGESEVVGCSVFDLVIPEHRDAYISMHRSVIEGHARTLQFEIQGLKGTRRWMESYAVPFLNPVTGQTEQLAVTHDITDRKRTEEALRESEQAIRALYEATATPGLSFDERIQAILQIGCRRFNLPIGVLTKVVGEDLELTHIWAPGTSFTVGMAVPACGTYCSSALQSADVVCFEHAKHSEWCNHPGCKALGLECYIGARMSGIADTYGTICFMGQDPYPGMFSQADKNFLQLMARWIIGELDRMAAERALVKSEKRYRALYDNTPTMYFTLTTDGTVLSVNRFGAEQLGYRVEELIGHSVLDTFHEQDKETVAASLSECLTTPETTRHWEFRKIRKDGTVIWVRETACVGPSSTGETVVLVTCEDTTERKREHEALAQLQLAVEQGMDGLALLRHDGCFIYMNQAFAAIYGYEVEELIGKPWQTLYGPEQQEVIKQYHWPFLELDGYWRGELVGRVKTGESIDLDLAFQKLTSGNTMQPDILCTCRDITDRKQAVRQERARINLIQEHQAELLALAQNKAIFSGDIQQAFQAITESVSRVLAVGRASIWLFQENPSAIRLADLYEVSRHAHSEGAILLADQFPAYFRALRQEQHTIAAHDAHIDPRTCEFAATYLTSIGIGAMLDAPIRYRGSVIGVLCHEHLGTSRTWTDDERTIAVSFASIATLAIEAKERSEADRAMIEAKQQAEAANAAKGTFLATMSHEIRTPMNAILGMAELLSESSLTEEQGKYVRIFRNAGHNLMVLLNNILDMAKVEARRLELERISFDLHEVLEKVVDLLAIKANDKQVELTCYVAPEVPHALCGDPNRLQQILINLVGNAVKFTDQGSIELRVLPDPDVSEPGALLFAVADTGIGIPPDKLNSIFERFTQAHSSTTRLYGGTGLGLAICKEMVKLMGGRIWAESHAGHGSTFLCKLKFEVAQDAAGDPVAATTDFNQLRVLVVDDNSTNRLIAVEALAGWQAQAVEAPDGQSALRELRRAQESGLPYELILLDSRLPDLDGFEVVAHIREDASLRRLAIVMLTSDFGNGMGHSNDIARTYDLGLAGYLQKPITRSQLRRIIAIALRRHQGLPPVPSDQTPTVPVDQRPLRILVVEDSLDNQLLMAAYLKSTPYQVDWAENGQTACDMAATNQYNLILMDMNMPVMDGYAATMAIREREQTQSQQPTVILALTAYCSPEDTRRIITCGCDAHLTKPIAKSALRNAIATYANTGDRPTASPNAGQSPQRAAQARSGVMP